MGGDTNSPLLDEARAHLAAALHGKRNPSESQHPWRKEWEFAVLHSLRVESYVVKILARQSHPLSPAEVELLQLAAILHDIARMDQRQGHALAGAALAREWLRAQRSLPEEAQARVVELIAVHSNKQEAEPDFGKAVLKDADTLDEIGAMSIFMSSNWLEHQSPFFFHRLRQRLVEVELPFCERAMGVLHTPGAKEILQEKKAFIGHFIAQLSDELQIVRSIRDNEHFNLTWPELELAWDTRTWRVRYCDDGGDQSPHDRPGTGIRGGSEGAALEP